MDSKSSKIFEFKKFLNRLSIHSRKYAMAVFNEWPILKAKIIRNNIQVPKYIKKNIIHSFNKTHNNNKNPEL